MNKSWTFVLMTCVLLSGCGGKDPVVPEKKEKKTEVGELVNVIVQMTVQDGEGHNLMDPGVEGCFAGSNALFAEFNGKTYFLNQDIGENGPQSPEISFYGLFSQHFYGFPYWLVFGGLDAYKDIDNEDLSIHWPNGRTDVVTIYNKYDFNKRDCERKFYLNGSEVENGFTIVLK